MSDSFNQIIFTWESLSHSCPYGYMGELEHNFYRLSDSIVDHLHSPYQYALWWLCMLPRLVYVWIFMKINGYYHLPSRVSRLMIGDCNHTLKTIQLSYFYIGVIILYKKPLVPSQVRFGFLWQRWLSLICFARSRYHAASAN